MTERPHPTLPAARPAPCEVGERADADCRTSRRVKAYVRSLLVAAFVLAAAAASLAGCTGSREPASRKPQAPATVVVDGKYSDKRFIDMMVPHHLMAIEMAEDALENSEDDDIRTLSERIVRGQANEIEELKRVRQELYGSRETPDEMHPAAMQNMGMGDHGSTASASSEHGDHGTSAGSTDEFDRRFLDDMLAHHAAAIQHASVALVRSDHKRLKIIAREIVDEQSREIGMMVGWRLDRWEHVL